MKMHIFLDVGYFFRSIQSILSVWRILKEKYTPIVVSSSY